MIHELPRFQPRNFQLEVIQDVMINKNKRLAISVARRGGKDYVAFAIADIIAKNGEKMHNEIFPVIGKLFNYYFCRKVNNGDKNFYVDERCNYCEICKEVCPVKNIKIVDGKPQWQHKCQRCLACIHFCPQKSIQYGKKTVKRKRYHHPEIKVNDIINQN